MNLMPSRGSGCLPRSSVMRLLMRRRYASFATSTVLPRTAHLAKCRRVASSFSYSNRPRPRWPCSSRRIDRLNKEINTSFADAKVKARLADLGGPPLAGSPTDFRKLIADETEKWGKVIRAANIKPE